MIIDKKVGNVEDPKLKQSIDSVRQKKVLFVANQDSFIELFLLPYARMLKEKGYEIHVATDTDKPIDFCDKKIKLPIKRNPFEFRDNSQAVKKLREIIAEEKYEIVHCHTPVGGVVARLAAKKARKNGTRVIYTAHGFHFYKGAPQHFWMMFYPVEKWLAKYTDTLITINDEDYKLALRKFARRCHDIQYVPGVGVDAKKFSKRMSDTDRTKYRKILGLNETDKVLICNGRIDANKNQEFLIGVMKKLVAKDPSYHLLLVGLDEDDGRCQKMVKALGLEDKVHFLGFHKDIPELLQIADVVLSASKREGLPVALTEAAMMGIPIVATNCRGNRDVCKQAGQTIVKQGDIKGFVRGVMNACNGSVIVDDEKRKEFMKKHDVKNVLEIMEGVYCKKKRVLHVLASDRFSGAENVACMIISNLSNEFDMAYCSPRGPIAKTLKERNIKYFGIDKLNHKNLKKVINEFKPDIIHAHDYRASLVASRFGNGCRVVSHIHQNNPRVRKLSPESLLYKKAIKNFVEIIWVSKESLRDFYFKDVIKSKSVVLRNVVDKKYIELMAKEYKVDEKYDVIFLGRLIDLKDPERAVEIIRLAKEKKNDIKMAMVGDGEKKEEIKKIIKAYGLEDNIKLFGFVENPYPILNNSKVLLITSKREGVPMAILEAQALGKPVVSVKIEGFEKIIKDGEDGILSNDNIILANGIVSMVKNPCMCNDKGHCGEVKNICATIKKIYTVNKEWD